MRPSTRLVLISVAIFLSSLYGLLILLNQEVAHALISGYVAVLLTIFFLCEVWKKNE